eukprot:SM000063S20036  [mRNA]  locus=s63:419240:425903:+ [translate_table: standard]
MSRLKAAHSGARGNSWQGKCYMLNEGHNCCNERLAFCKMHVQLEEAGSAYGEFAAAWKLKLAKYRRLAKCFTRLWSWKAYECICTSTTRLASRKFSHGVSVPALDASDIVPLRANFRSPAVFSAVWPVKRVLVAPAQLLLQQHDLPSHKSRAVGGVGKPRAASQTPARVAVPLGRPSNALYHFLAALQGQDGVAVADGALPAPGSGRAFGRTPIATPSQAGLQWGSSPRQPLPLPRRSAADYRTSLGDCRCRGVPLASLAIGESGGEAPLAEAVLGTPTIEVQEKPKLSQATLIWRAAKLPMYTVGLIPLTVAAAAAYLKTGIFQASRYWSFLFYSVLVLLNDAHDAETGVDKDKPESVVNMTGSQPLVLGAAYLCLVAGVWGISIGATSTGDLRVAWLLAAAIACGYVYQCPPFRLSYKGLGEPLCFLAFGPLATTAFYLYQASLGRTQAPVTPEILGASVLVGITTTLILFCSHFHQIEGDLQVGKMSPLVSIGTAKGAQVATAGVFSLYIITAALVVFKLLPPNCLVGALMTLPLGKLVVDFVSKNHMDKNLIFMAKYYCVRLHVVFGFMLALSLTSTVSFPIRPFW